MPDWMRWISDNQPITPIIRGLLMGTDLGDRPLLALGWIALILAISVVWGAIMFRRKAGRR